MTHHRSPSDGAAAPARALELLAAYGADRERWPADERTLFDALAGDETFEIARLEEAALDAALAEAPTAICGEDLKQNILVRFPESRAGDAGFVDAVIAFCTHGLGRLAPIGAAAGLSALGFAIGAASAGSSTGISEDEALYYALDTSIVEVSEGDALWADEI